MMKEKIIILRIFTEMTKMVESLVRRILRSVRRWRIPTYRNSLPIGLTFFHSAATCLHLPARLTRESMKREGRKPRTSERHVVGCCEQLCRGPGRGNRSAILWQWAAISAASIGRLAQLRPTMASPPPFCSKRILADERTHEVSTERMLAFASSGGARALFFFDATPSLCVI